MAGLVADYGSSSEEENENNKDTEIIKEEENDAELIKQLSSRIQDSKTINYFESPAEKSKKPKKSKKSKKSKPVILDNPLRKKSKSIPSPFEDDSQASVFFNPFHKAEEDKKIVLEKHVKMTQNPKDVLEINGKKICWNYRKGRCKFGHNCKYAHDSDIIQSNPAQSNSAPDQLDTNSAHPPSAPTNSAHGYPGQTKSAHGHSGRTNSSKTKSAHGYSAQTNSGHAYSAHGYSAQTNSAHGYSAQTNSSHQYSTQTNSSHGYSAQTNSGHAYSAQTNSSHGYSAQTNSAHGYSAHEYSANSSFGDEIEEEQKKKRRPGLSDGIVPGKKVQKLYKKQQAKETPWLL